MRKLAHIEKIKELKPIKDADRIEVATVLGWQCVVKKGEFKVGDMGIYVEIDSLMPSLPEYEFLKDKGYRVRTIKLKKQISQGLFLRFDSLPKGTFKGMKAYAVGQDVTKLLNVTKYIPACERHDIEMFLKKANVIQKFLFKFEWYRKVVLKRGAFPDGISITKEERIQNIPTLLQEYKDNEIYLTEKIDGESCTFTTSKDKHVVAMREYSTTDKTTNGWKLYNKYNLNAVLKDNPGITIQGEFIMGGTKYDIKESTMWVFNIIDHEKNYHYNIEEIIDFCHKYKLNIVPLLIQKTDYNWNTTLKKGYNPQTCKLSELGSTVQELVEFSKGKSAVNPNIEREGIVVRCIIDGKKILSFKVINPNFLLKYEK